MNDAKFTITCPSCSTEYALTTAQIGSGRRALKCAVCKDTFVVEPVQETPDPSADSDPFAYDPETSPWDTDPDHDPVLDQTEEEESTDPDSESNTEAGEDEDKELEDAWVDYDSVSLDELTFGDADEDEKVEGLEFGDEGEEESSEPVEEMMAETGPAPEPQPPAGKLDPTDDSITLDGRPVDEVKKSFAGAADSLTHPDELPDPVDGDSDEQDGEETMEPVPSPVELPDVDPESEIGDPEETAAGKGESPLAALMKAEEESKPQRRKERSTAKRSFVRGSKTAEPEELRPTSGMIYYILIMVIGVGALASSFFPLGLLSFDPVWGGGMIALGALGFVLQNLSGIYIAGFFSMLYSFALFGRISSQITAGNFTGIMHIGAIFGLAFILSLTYALLIGRRRGHFVLKESSFQSIASFILGLLALIYGFWSLIESAAIAPLGQWEIMGTAVEAYTWYGGVALQIIAQAAAAAGAIAFGISAHRLRNSKLILAKVGILLGVVIIGLLFATVYLKTLTFQFPV